MSLASADALATTSPDDTVIDGQTVRFPVIVRDASSASTAFLVPASAARDLLPDDSLEVVELFPGRTLLSIAAIDYRDNDLGDYNEVSIALFVRPRGSAGRFARLAAIGDLARNRLATYIVWLPVDQAFTREAGERMWGFPKTVETIDFDARADTVSCRLESEGRHVLTLEAFRGGDKELPESTMKTMTLKGGRLHATAFTSRATGVGFRAGGATLTLGDHPFAERLRALGLPRKPLFTVWMEHMYAVFAPAEEA